MNFSKNTQRGRRRMLPVIAILSAAVVALTGCGTSGGGSDPVVTDGLPLRIGHSDVVMNLDPFQIPTGGRETRAVKRQIFDALVVQGDDLVPTPQLAESWETPTDTTWVFNLRTDVKFHDGEQFDASTVKYNMDLVLDPDGGSPSHSKFAAMVKSVTVVDDYTIEIETIKPAPSLLTALAFQELVPGKYRETVGAEAFNLAPVGTGPFKFVSQTQEKVVVERNDDYWGGKAATPSVTFKHIPEVSARIAALQTGEVDIIDQIPRDLAGTLSGDVEAVSTTGTRIYFAAMNVTQAPFTDVNVRRALASAVDTDTIAGSLYGGDAVALNQPAFPTMFGYQKDAEGFKFDLDAAKTVLSTVTTPITLDVKQGDLTLAEAVAGQLATAGLTVNIQAIEDEAFSVKIEAGLSQMYVSSWGVAEGDLDAILTRHFWTPRGDTSAYTNYSDATMDALIDAGRSTTDQAKRFDIYVDVIDQLVKDAPWRPLVTPNEFYGVSSSVSGWAPAPTGLYHLNKAVRK